MTEWTVPRRSYRRVTSAGNDWPALLASCRADLRARRIVVPEPFDLDTFVALLARQRGRQLHLIPMAQPAAAADLTATSVVGPGVDYVFYVDSSSSLHQSHIVLHEIAHLIFGTVHSAWTTDWLDAADLSDTEREAEAFAALLLGRWQDPAPYQWSSSSPLRLGAERLATTLGWQ